VFAFVIPTCCMLCVCSENSWMRTRHRLSSTSRPPTSCFKTSTLRCVLACSLRVRTKNPTGSLSPGPISVLCFQRHHARSLLLRSGASAAASAFSPPPSRASGSKVVFCPHSINAHTLVLAQPVPSAASAPARSVASFSPVQAQLICQQLVAGVSSMQTVASQLGALVRHFTANVSLKEVCCVCFYVSWCAARCE
jgi:hypothetical protein